MYQKNPLLLQEFIIPAIAGFHLGSAAYRDHIMRLAHDKIMTKYPDARMLYNFLNSNPRTQHLAEDLTQEIDLDTFNPNRSSDRRKYSIFIGERLLKDSSWKYILSFLFPLGALPYHMVKHYKVKHSDADTLIDPERDSE